MPATNIKITAQDKTKKAFGSVNKSVSGLQKSVTSLKGALRGIGTALGAAAFVNFTKRTLDSADALGKTADRLGLTTEALQTLHFAATQSGMSTEMLEMSMQRFTRRMAEANSGTGVLKDTFKELGIEITTPNGRLKSAESILGDVADKMAAIPDQAERVKLAFKMFDSEGVKMVNVLQGGSENLAKMRQELINTGAIMTDVFIDDAEAANDALDKLSRSVKTGFSAAIAGLAPIITNAADAITDLIAVARKYPVLTSLATAVAGIGIAFSLWGGWVTLGITAISGLITAGSALNNHLNKQKELANVAGLSLEKLQKHHKSVTKEINDTTKALKDGAPWYMGARDKGWIQQQKEKIKALKETRTEIQAAIQGLQKEAAANEEVAKAKSKVIDMNDENRRQQLQISKWMVKDAEDKAAKISEINQLMYTKELDLAHANAEIIRQLQIKEAKRRSEALKIQKEAMTTWMDEKRAMDDASMAAIESNHERQKQLVDDAYMGEIKNKELHTANMLKIDKAYDKAVLDLHMQRSAVIAGQASELAQELNKQGVMGFDAMKAFAIAEATINAYVAASKAWAQGGTFGAISAGLTLAAAMVQVDNIRRSKPPKREFGGAVSKGKSYLVGERGAEMFTPNESGKITSNDNMNKSANVTFNINANDARGFDQLLQKRRGLIVGLINRALHENGQRALI